MRLNCKLLLMGEANEKCCEQVEKLRPRDWDMEKGVLCSISCNQKELESRSQFLF